MKSILLIGAGRFGKHFAIQLNQFGHQIMALDKNEERVNDIMDIVTNAHIGDSTNEEVLRSLGVDNYDICIVAIGSDFQSSLETTYLLKELGAKYVVSRAEHDSQAKFLLRNGADEIVYPEKQVAKWAATRFSYDHVLDYIALDDVNSIFEVSVPVHWVGKSIGHLDIRRKYDVNILAIKKDGKIKMSLTPDTVLTEDITLLALADVKNLKKCFHI